MNILDGISVVNRTGRFSTTYQSLDYDHALNELSFKKGGDQSHSYTTFTITLPFDIQTGEHMIGDAGSPIKAITFTEYAVSAAGVEPVIYHAKGSPVFIVVTNQGNDTTSYTIAQLNLKMVRDGSPDETSLQGNISFTREAYSG